MEYEIIRKKIKNIYMRIKDGKVIVTAPYRISQKEIERLVNEKSKWISKQLVKQEKINNNKKNTMVIVGKVYPIIEHKSNRNYIELGNDEVNIYLCNRDEKDTLIKQFYRKCAQKQYITTIKKMVEKTGLEPNSWRVRDIQYAWGSCSSKRNITLSLNLIQKREELIEYVVVHELCHLKHMNHSTDFWNLVGKYIPNYKEYRKELKSYDIS